MKRLVASFLTALILVSMAGCHRITIHDNGNATLKYSGKWMGDTTEVTQILTEEETRNVKAYLTSATYTPGQGGCPFDEDISITFGDQVFCIAYDGCAGVRLGTDKYFQISEEGRQYIVSLFVKYVDYFPYA